MMLYMTTGVVMNTAVPIPYHNHLFLKALRYFHTTSIAKSGTIKNMVYFVITPKPSVIPHHNQARLLPWDARTKKYKLAIIKKITRPSNNAKRKIQTAPGYRAIKN